MKKIFVLIISSFMLFSCTGVNMTPEKRLAQAEVTYAGILTVLTEARKPCVDADSTNDYRCFINDKTYRKVDVYVEAATKAIEKADKYLSENDLSNFEDQFVIISDNLGELEEIADEVKEKN